MCYGPLCDQPDNLNQGRSLCKPTRTLIKFQIMPSTKALIIAEIYHKAITNPLSCQLNQ